MKVHELDVVRLQAPERLRVAAYVRVSEESERLLHSYEAQQEYYESMIMEQEGWELARIYSDRGISGTTTARRPAFCRMIADCEAGYIDLILTKSVSRFARNALDLLRIVRRLKELGVAVHFEKERLDTASQEGELILSLLAAGAQEESRSISENIKWGIRKRFREGIGNQHVIYGYRWDGSHYHIREKEAENVRRIFTAFLDGISPERLEKQFAVEGIKGPRGGRFYAVRMRAMLENERYTGDQIFQKEYIIDHITHRRARNRGELARYYAQGVAPPIVSHEVFEAVQAEIARRRERRQACQQ